MKGKYKVIIQNKRIHYEFDIKRNLTIIRGESATGKTALVDMVREHYENGTASGVQIQCEKPCVILEGRNWALALQTFHDCIVFIDEGNTFVSSMEFASQIQKTSNYYVIVTRESLPALPYSVDEIYGIRHSGKYGSLKQTYNEMYHIYGVRNYGDMVRPQEVLTEDSHAGYQFFSSVCKANELTCITSNGKSNIYGIMEKNQSQNMLVIADGAAIGSEIDRIMKLMYARDNIALYLPESFEWMILKAGLIHDKEVKNILNAPEQYVESEQYFSWERYFTDLLIHRSEGTYYQYSKKMLPQAYLHEITANKILQVMEKVDLRWQTKDNDSEKQEGH